MNFQFKHLIALLVILFISTGFTCWEISIFTDMFKECNDDIEKINYCGCIPCNSGLSTILNKTEYDCIMYNIEK